MLPGGPAVWPGANLFRAALRCSLITSGGSGCDAAMLSITPWGVSLGTIGVLAAVGLGGSC